MPTREQLDAHWSRRDYTPPKSGMDCEFFFHSKGDEGGSFSATYRPKAFRNVDQFLVEMSLPKLVLGNNWTMLDDLCEAIVAADRALRHPALPELPSVADMAVSRLDLCWNFQVGELLPYYIDALSKLDYARRTKARFNSQTVEFRARSSKTKFYDKRAEAGKDCPPGILRMELTLHRARAVKKAFDSTRPIYFGRLEPAVLRAVLVRELETLGIADKPFATVNEAAAVLRATYGPSRGAYRFMVLQMYQTRDRDQIALELGISRNLVNEYLADVEKAGLPLAISEAKASLPPLTIPILDTEPTQIPTETPGVTPGCFGPEQGGDDPCE